MFSTEVGFSLSHGRYHSGDCWSLVQPELHQAGYGSVAPTYDVGEGSRDVDELASDLAVAEDELAVSSIIRVAWSWSSNIIPREIGTRVSQIVFIAPAFHPNTIAALGGTENQHSLPYDILNDIISQETSPEVALAKLRSMAEIAFYHDVPDLIRETAKNDLRLHPKRQDEPVLPKFPKHLPATVIATTRDMAVPYRSQLELAGLIAAQVEDFETGHAPMLSRPAELAKLLIRLSSQV